ncbi:MAG: hypothetical protein ACXVEF_27395 [Polyangiales bacterium]
MRSPFAPDGPTSPAPKTPPKPSLTAEAVEVPLEEAALFEPPAPRALPALRRTSTAPPPRRSKAPPRFRDEETVKHDTPNWLLSVLANERDSARLRAAARSGGGQVDLSKTVEEPTFEDE